VIRTVWLTVLCLSGAVGAVAIGAGTSTPPSIVAASPEQPVADEISLQDTLTEADRQEIAYVRDALAAEPAVTVARRRIHHNLPRRSGPRIVKRHGDLCHEVCDRVDSTRHRRSRSRLGMSPAGNRRRPRRVDTEGFAGLLRALNLTHGCDT
jgi:hypothetical protein